MERLIHFYIIYLPETVWYLLPLVNSLVRWSDCSYSLVANGCSTSEQRILSSFCDNYSQLSYLRLPFDKVVPHGVALNFLQKNNSYTTFGFMDSDIFATGPFLPSLLEAMNSNIGVFSGSPIWCKISESILQKEDPRIFGRHHTTIEGSCLGSTYFALYHHKKLIQQLPSTEQDFRIKRWGQLSRTQQKMVAQQKLNKTFYDTGKLLNIALLNKGENLIFLDLPHLIHLGGFSRYSKHQSKKLSERIKIIFKKIGQKKFQSILTQLPYWINTEWFLPRRMSLHKSKLLRQVIVEKYVSNLIIGMVDNKTPPTWQPTKDKELDLKITAITKSLKTLYKAALLHFQISKKPTK